MSEEPQRVRVTGPPRRHRAPVPRADDLPDEDAADRLDEIYLRSLMRAQLGLALGVLLALLVGVGGTPLVFWLFPSLARISIVGIPIPWLLLGVLVYPCLVVLGGWFVHRAERNERHFTELLERTDVHSGTGGP